MVEHQLLILGILNGTAALLGVYFMLRAGRAWSRHRSRHLLVLGIAVALLTLGVVVEGFLHSVLGWELASAHVIEAGVGLVAFAVLVASLHL